MITPKINECKNKLLELLKDYGSMLWHTSKHNSVYIKFKDTRLGSIRISDHSGRDKYNYTYEIFVNEIDNIDEKINEIVNSIICKSKRILNFNSEKFIVYSNGTYLELKNLKEYKKFILERNK